MYIHTIKSHYCFQSSLTQTPCHVFQKYQLYTKPLLHLFSPSGAFLTSSFSGQWSRCCSIWMVSCYDFPSMQTVKASHNQSSCVPLPPCVHIIFLNQCLNFSVSLQAYIGNLDTKTTVITKMKQRQKLYNQYPL